jgi:hypothetical protein
MAVERKLESRVGLICAFRKRFASALVTTEGTRGALNNTTKHEESSKAKIVQESELDLTRRVHLSMLHPHGLQLV